MIAGITFPFFLGEGRPLPDRWWSALFFGSLFGSLSGVILCGNIHRTVESVCIYVEQKTAWLTGILDISLNHAVSTFSGAYGIRTRQLVLFFAVTARFSDFPGHYLGHYILFSKYSTALLFISLSTSESVSRYTRFITLSVFHPPRAMMY